MRGVAEFFRKELLNPAVSDCEALSNPTPFERLSQRPRIQPADEFSQALIANAFARRWKQPKTFERFHINRKPISKRGFASAPARKIKVARFSRLGIINRLPGRMNLTEQFL